MEHYFTPLEAALTRPDLGSDAFRGFDADARRVMDLAHEEGERFEQHYIGTEHLLVGLLLCQDPIVVAALRSFDLAVGNVRMALTALIARGDVPDPPPSQPLTKRARKVIDLARDEAGHGPVRPRHLLLGLVREGEGVAAMILQELGVELAELRSTILDHLAPGEER